MFQQSVQKWLCGFRIVAKADREDRLRGAVPAPNDDVALNMPDDVSLARSADRRSEFAHERVTHLALPGLDGFGGTALLLHAKVQGSQPLGRSLEANNHRTDALHQADRWRSFKRPEKLGGAWIAAQEGDRERRVRVRRDANITHCCGDDVARCHPRLSRKLE
jgi:hypothetical protein